MCELMIMSADIEVKARLAEMRAFSEKNLLMSGEQISLSSWVALGCLR